MNSMIKSCCAILILIPVFYTPARADFFQYTDGDGTVVIVDDESKIPAKYRNKTRATKSESAADSKSTAVRITNNRVYVPVRINYRDTTVDARFLLDTGASITTISTGLANRLGIKPANTERGMARVADGRILQTYRTRVDYVAVGPKLKYNSEVAIMPSNGPASDYDGLLGMNFLGEFRYHLDVNNQTIEWLQ